MASSVFYKFNSRKDESRVTFDGTGISVFDLKRDIILANNMGKANDFDLFIYDSSSNKEYTDDSEIIPRSSSVIVKRRPAARPGKGKASMYIAGAGNSVPTSEPVQRGGPGAGSSSWHKGAMSKRFDVKDEHSSAPKPAMVGRQAPDTALLTFLQSAKPATSNDDETSAMAAMFQAQTANWEETQEKMSQLVSPLAVSCPCRFSRGGKPHTPHQAPPQAERPLPASYVCYRCGQKGHWIQDCPTNNDREFDHRPRIKRTTGIPRSMLKAVENPNIAELGQGVMVTPDGGYVVAQPDSASWQKQVSRPKGLTAVEVRERVPTDSSLVCPIDNKLIRDAVKTPCCGTLYCEECVQTHLLERDFLCPNCAKKIASLDKLIIDKPMRTKVTDYIENAIEESRKEGNEEGVAGTANEGSATKQSSAVQESVSLEQDYSDQQPGGNIDMSKMVADSIPQLQAQIVQISAMLQNPSLPNHVRQNTQMQHHHLQIQLAQAQEMATAMAIAGFQQQQLQNSVAGMNYNNMQGYNQGGWANAGYSQQPGQDSAYQRLPVNRRRVLKRDRPQDFLEVGGENDSKVARYWE
ncbi:DWNN domain-containing protein [Mycena sp. CBHHK59/15]|nr:DWNN domain-containing protein [Mycena sp. CBHHK59/15]